MCQVQLYSVLVAIFAFIQTGYAIRCWVCDSPIDIQCRDYFNITRLEQNKRLTENSINNQNNSIQQIITSPHLESCEAKQAPPSDYKYVCSKTISKDIHHNGPPIVHRRCTMVRLDFEEGYCPDELSHLSNLSYCRTCEKDGCNSGRSLRNNIFLYILVPVGFLLFFQK